MTLLPVGPDPRWRPAAILENFERLNGQDRVTNNLVLHPVLISGIVNGTPFKFYTKLSREKYNIYIYGNLGILKWSNFALCLRVLQTHVT